VVDAPGFEHVAYGEPLTVWLREVTELQQALSLWQQAKHVKPLGDPDALKMFRDLIAASPHPATTGPWPDVSDDSITMPHVKLLTVASIDPANTLSEKDARHLAWLHLSHVVTARLKTHTEPCLVYAEALARPQFHVVPKTLLGAVWLQLALAITRDKNYRCCEFCGAWFAVVPGEGHTLARRFCSTNCRVRANRHKRREGRA